MPREKRADDFSRKRGIISRGWRQQSGLALLPGPGDYLDGPYLPHSLLDYYNRTFPNKGPNSPSSLTAQLPHLLLRFPSHLLLLRCA
ncbi:Hypothetical protein NTJ_03631 [Nesidiocoris tenuis]|uniref:Uncharacterized protein n=1 Tax=Nesidiocoris tenuis TaxID=355587 RepID=A0ABN7AEX0_9HEMI|nr:Hypothetical protein NTJ_03631 [Nesidiocoris tenuis]